MKRVLLDTNFILDLLARNGEYQANAIKVLETGREKGIKFFISFLSLANYAYIIRKESKERLFENLKTCCRLFKVIPNNESQIIRAIELNPSDFEDAIQYSAAIEEKCDCIITRNKKDFMEFSQIPVFTPLEFMQVIQG